MGKKTTTSTNATAPAKRAAKPSIKTKRLVEPAIITPPPKAAANKNGGATGAKTAKKPAAKATPASTQADISLRAYFIAENRMAAGLPGDSHQDWLEAERQIMAEAAAAKKPKQKAGKA